MHPSSSGKTRVAFVHPDLGLGGAERLVVDAAVELVRAGCSVDVYTAHYDPQRCFEETKTGGFRVVVAGSWFPRSLGGRFIALCAYIRCLIAAVHLAWCSWRPGVSGVLLLLACSWGCTRQGGAGQPPTEGDTCALAQRAV